MVKKLNRILFGIAVSALFLWMPLSVSATDEEPTTEDEEGNGNANGEEIKESTGDPGKLPYASGDRPIYLYTNGYVTGYFVIHIDATYTSMSKDQYEDYAERYCKATGTEYYEPFGEAVYSDDFGKLITAQAEQYYSTNIEVAHAVAREIFDARLIPGKSPDLSYDLYWFDYVPEEDGEYHYYRYQEMYFKVKDDVYNAYLALDDNVHSESAVTGVGVGNGTVYFYAYPSDSIKELSLYLVYQDKETSEEEVIYLNPPNYNNMITLPYGTYKVTGGGLYEDRGFPIDMEYPEFTVVEGESIAVGVKYAAAGENLELSGYTPEEMEEINKQYADSSAFMTDEESDIAPAQFITEQPVEPQKNGKSFWIIMGVIGFIVVGGITILIIRRRQQEDY